MAKILSQNSKKNIKLLNSGRHDFLLCTLIHWPIDLSQLRKYQLKLERLSCVTNFLRISGAPLKIDTSRWKLRFVVIKISRLITSPVFYIPDIFQYYHRIITGTVTRRVEAAGI